MSDLTGVPDILTRIKPILLSLVPGREPSPRVQELKPWVRIVVTVYVAVLVPVLLFMLVTMVLHAPRMFATAYDSMGVQVDRVGAAASGGHPARVALGVLQALALALPCGAVVVSLSRVGRRAGRGVRAWSGGSARRSALAVTGVAALVGLAAWTWWPNGDYEPIRPGEKGTVGQAVRSISEVPSGRPAFTTASEQRFGSVPTVREREAAERSGRAPAASRDERSRDAPEATPTATPETGDGTSPSGAATPAPDEPAGTATPAAPAETATAEPTAAATETPIATATP
jgi:putative peptide zinc metalloprotease protein